MTTRHACALMAAALLAGCSDETPSSEPPPEGSIVDGYEPAPVDATNIEGFAGMSAPNVFSTGLLGVIIAGVNGEDTCPKITETETQTTIEGGCTDEEGQTWFGTAISNAAGISYSDFGNSSQEACGEDAATGEASLTLNGTSTMSGTGTDKLSFSVELVMDAVHPDPNTCEPVASTGAIDYAGSALMPSGSLSSDEPSTWNGSGRVGFDGVGRVDVSTVDELVDGTVCETEAASGKTIIRSDNGDEAVIVYDGASDCDPDSTVTWTLNGIDQGELTGVDCSASPGRSSPNALAIFGVFAAVALRRRRR